MVSDRGHTEQRGSSKASPSTVAQSVARDYATILYVDSGTPHPSQRKTDAAARSIPTSCSVPQHDQYPCIVHPPNKTPPVQACTAVANASGDVAVGAVRCGDRASPFPIVRPGYVNCTRIGRVVTVRGEAHTFTRTPSDPRDDSRAHLLEVRVASNAQQLCWDFETASPPAVGERMYLGVAGATPGLDFTTADGPSAQDGSSAIDGQAGSSGRWTSLLVSAADLDPALRAFPGHYAFVANTEWNNTQPGTKYAVGEDTVHGTYP